MFKTKPSTQNDSPENSVGTVARRVSALIAALVLFASLQPCKAISSEFKIVPGARIGLARLGDTSAQAKRLMGNIDGSYKLANGDLVEFAEWKDDDPAKRMIMKYFYGQDGKIKQIMTNAPVPRTADGIGINSTLAQIKARYPKLVDASFEDAAVSPAVSGKADRYCLDDSKSGIAFCLRKSTKGGPDELFAYIVHAKGQKLLLDLAGK